MFPTIIIGRRWSQNNSEESKQFQRCGQLYEAGWGGGGAGGCLQNPSLCQNNPACLNISCLWNSTRILLLIISISQVAPAPKRKREDEDYDNNWISLPAQIWSQSRFGQFGLCDCPNHWYPRLVLSCQTDFRCVPLGVWHDEMGNLLISCLLEWRENVAIHVFGSGLDYVHSVQGGRHHLSVQRSDALPFFHLHHWRCLSHFCSAQRTCRRWNKKEIPVSWQRTSHPSGETFWVSEFEKTAA